MSRVGRKKLMGAVEVELGELTNNGNVLMGEWYDMNTQFP